MPLFRNVVASLAGLALAGCSSLPSLSGKPIDYKSTNTLPPLEIPPDLTTPGTDDRFVVPDTSARSSASASAYAADRASNKPAGQSGVLPTAAKVRFERAGSQRWLVIDADAEQVWPTVRQFWLEQGFILTIESPTTGVLETDWAENRAKLPMDFIRNTLGKVLDSIYSTGERDKFRTRLERSTDGKTTEIYITHRGMVEVADKRSANTSIRDSSTDSTVWQPRPADPELEAEFLQRLMVRLGVDEAAAKTQVAGKNPAGQDRARLSKSAEGTRLTIDERFDRAWRRVGLALDRVGFTVEDRDRANGNYFVRYADPDSGKKKDGILDKLAFWRDKDDPKKAISYKVTVVDNGNNTTDVRVINPQGERDTSDTATRILTLLHEQLR